MLSTLRPTPKLEDHPLSAVRDCLFNIFAATHHIGGRSSIRKLRTRHAMPWWQGTTYIYIYIYIYFILNCVCIYLPSGVSITSSFPSQICVFICTASVFLHLFISLLLILILYYAYLPSFPIIFSHPSLLSFNFVSSVLYFVPLYISSYVPSIVSFSLNLLVFDLHLVLT